MPDWSSLAEVNKEAGVLTDLIFVLFGGYVWEILLTLGFEWSLITRERKFTWPLILFFLCRYCLLFALIGMIVSFGVKSPINCQALYTWISVTGNLAILAASTALLVRTIAMWNRKVSVTLPLGILCLAHWAILFRGMFLINAEYSTEAQACVVTYTNHVFLNISFFSTMGVDFIVLCFTIVALMRQELHSGLWKLLFADGLIYFCVTFVCNALPAILNVLNLNTVMDIIATIPAATVSTIAACRLVMRLHNFSSESFVNTSSAVIPGQFAMVNRPPRPPQIHVTTDQFIVEDFSLAASNSLRKRAEAAAESPQDYESCKDLESPTHDHVK